MGATIPRGATAEGRGGTPGCRDGCCEEGNPALWERGLARAGPRTRPFLGQLVGFSCSAHTPVPCPGLLVELLRRKKPLLLARSDVVISPLPLRLSQEAQQMREAMSASTRMSDWALKRAGTDRPRAQAGRPCCAGLALGIPESRLRGRGCSPRQREVGPNPGAQEHACGRAAPLGSPPSRRQTPRWCRGRAPAGVSAPSLFAELSWGAKADGWVILCCPRGGASAWVCSPSRGGLLSPSSRGPSLCAAAGRETPSPGTGMPSFPGAPPRVRCGMWGGQADLEVTCCPQVLRAWGLLQSAALFSLQGLPSTCRDRPASLHGSARRSGSCVLRPLWIPLCR